MDKHPEQSSEFGEQDSDKMVLKIVAEQNAVIIEEMETLKKDTKGALELLTVIVEERVGGITDDINNKCESLRDMVLKIYNKVSKHKVTSNTVGSSRCSPKEPITKKTKRKLKLPSGASKPFVSSSPGTKSIPKPSPVWSSMF